MSALITTYSPGQVADLLGLPKSTILAAIERAELPAIRINRRVFRITATDTAIWWATKGGRLKSTPATRSVESGEAHADNFHNSDNSAPTTD